MKFGKGQGSTELLLILAAVLFIIVVAIFLSNEQLTSVSQTRDVNKAVVFSDSIASAADEVYYQGYGARKRLLIDVPENIDANQTYITGSSIVVTTSNTTIVSDAQVPIHGILPLTPGRHEVWVISEGSSVRIGNVFISIDKGSLFFTISESDSDSEDIEVENVYDQNINVSVSVDWLYGSQVSVGASPSSFSLTPGQKQDITVSVQSFSGSAGVYDGDIVINATDGASEDSVSVPVTVYVLPPTGGNGTYPSFFVTPDDWNVTVQKGQTINKYFYVCTGIGITINTVTFSTSGTAGGWVWNLGQIGPISPENCIYKLFYITVPTTQASGNYTGTITAIGDGTYSDDIQLYIEVIDSTDDKGPKVKVLNINPTNPREGQNITVNATCDDTTEGNSNIWYAEIDFEKQCGWTQMPALDGSYDSPVEQVYYNLYPLPQGKYEVQVRCVDIWGNVGSAKDKKFKVGPPDTQPPEVKNLQITPSNPSIYDSILVSAKGDDSGRGDSNIQICNVEIDSNGTLIPMDAVDGAYDEKKEDVQKNIGTLPAGPHNATVYCTDISSNTGNSTISFTVSTSDTAGPLSLYLNITTQPSGSKWKVYAHATGDDTTTGNSNIKKCRAKIDNGKWKDMSADDGSYDSPVEAVSKDMGKYHAGSYTLYAKCQDVQNNWGPTNSTIINVP